MTCGVDLGRSVCGCGCSSCTGFINVPTVRRLFVDLCVCVRCETTISCLAGVSEVASLPQVAPSTPAADNYKALRGEGKGDDPPTHPSMHISTSLSPDRDMPSVAIIDESVSDSHLATSLSAIDQSTSALVGVGGVVAAFASPPLPLADAPTYPVEWVEVPLPDFVVAASEPELTQPNAKHALIKQSVCDINERCSPASNNKIMTAFNDANLNAESTYLKYGHGKQNSSVANVTTVRIDVRVPQHYVMTCPLCEFKCNRSPSNNRTRIKNHLREQHNVQAIYVMICSVCEFKCDSSKAVQVIHNHMKKQHGNVSLTPIQSSVDLAFQCSQCDRKFAKLHSLSNHARIHKDKMNPTTIVKEARHQIFCNVNLSVHTKVSDIVANDQAVGRVIAATNEPSCS